MNHGLKLRNDMMAAIFEEWNKTELDCYLIEITAKITAKKDDPSAKGHVLD